MNTGVTKGKRSRAREELPLVLYVAVSQKELNAAVARRQLRASNGGPIAMFRRPEQAAKRGPTPHVVLRVAAREAASAGIEVVKGPKNRYGAARIPLQFVACSKLPRSIRGVRRVDAAGGVVVRDGDRPRVLVLQKEDAERMRWVLPKGRRRRSEARRRAAHREVLEETGLVTIKVGKFLARERYFDVERERVVFKQVSYYLTRCPNDKARIKVNGVEGFTSGRWVSLEKALEDTSAVRAHLSLRKARAALKARAPRPPRRAKTV
jgi:8-oxo-dGTP pyrophosphatase MutT (NUDIX family)